jgi:carbon storage regulator CsrA
MKSEKNWLVLGRKALEEICIGDDIRVKVVSKDGSTFRIAIHAPNGVKVLRSELFDKSKTQKGTTEQ